MQAPRAQKLSLAAAMLGGWLGAACDGKTDDPSADTDDTVVDTDIDTPAVPPPTVVLNEVVPSNKSTVNGSDGLTHPDWVEIVNTGDKPVPLARLSLQSASGGRWEGDSADGYIRPGAHKLLWLHADIGAPGVWTGFTLDKHDDTLTLIGDGTTVLGEVHFTDVASDIALARIPDITGEFVPTAWTTPAAANGDAPSPTLDAADETWFRTDIVHQIHFTIDEDAWKGLNQFDRPEVAVGLEVDGVAFAQIGLHLKGSASYTRMNSKPGFVVDLNALIADQSLRGLKKFKLHNGKVFDPTHGRDHITYKLATAAGLMAPRTGYAEVYCNSTYYGIYSVVESYDDVMIERNRPGKGDGVVFEPNEPIGGTWTSDFGWGDTPMWSQENGPTPMPAVTQAALDAVNQIVQRQATDANVAELFTYVDRANFLSYMAWEAVIMNTDGYMAPNNWRLFSDPDTGMFSWMPSGSEWTWSWDTSAWSSGGQVANFCLNNRECKRDYAKRLLEVADLVDSMHLLDEFNAIQTQLDPLIQADPRYRKAWGSLDEARATTKEHLVTNPQLSRQQVYDTFPALAPP